MRMTSPARPRLASAFILPIAALVLVGRAPTAAAQEADAHWQPWLGCWKVADSLSETSRDQRLSDLVCVIPSGSSSVEFATIEDGEVVGRDTIAVTGQKETINRGGCDGWESAEWSSVGERLYIRSERTCPGGLLRTASGLMSITSTGEWLDVRGLAAGTNRGVRVLRYEAVEPAAFASRVPEEIVRALGDRGDAMSTARLAAGRRLARADVIEASRQLESNVVEAWLVENQHGFRLDARDLVELADAGVPGSVTDLMIALSYPRAFVVNHASRQAELLPAEMPGDSLSDDYPRHPAIYPIWDPWAYPPYGYGGYGAGYGRGFGYGPGFGGWYPGGQVIVVVPGTGAAQSAEESNGRVVKGKGYQRGHTDTSPSSSPPERTRSTSSSSGSTSSTPASSSSEGSSNSGSGRTAKPREN